ncbi:hypothetical protein HKD37_18G050384 [Glycine soja]
MVKVKGVTVETRGYMDLMITFGHGQLSRSFLITYLLVDADTSYFALISRKTLNELGAIVSTLHLKMKFPTLTGEIVTVKVAPYPPTRDPAKPHPTAAEGTQVMSVDEVPQIRTLTVYQASLDDEFNIDSQ